MLFVKLKTFHKNNNNNNMSKRKMPATAVKWVNLTALCVLLTVVLLPSPANGFTPIGGGSGGGFRNGEGRKLFGGYRITPKHCRGTKTLPASDPRSNGPTICMFNHECAQRNGEVVGACMDGFLFGACCQVPLSNANQNTLIQDAQNPNYQMVTHSTEGYDSDLYSGNHKFESDEFQEIQSSSSKLHDVSSTESSYMEELVSQKIHKVNTTSAGNKIFYVNKGSVMVSSPSSVSNSDEYIMMSSSQSPYGSGNSGVSFTTELPTKISTDLMDNEDSTQIPPMIMSETVQTRKNYSSGALDLDMGEFTHSDITHPGAESVLIDSDLQFSTGYGGPQSVYVPPPSHAEIIPPRRKPSIGSQTIGNQNKKPSNDKYVLIQTLEASKKPSQGAGTTSTGISTNIDSIESIILMLNGTNHGPPYKVANTSPSYNQQPSYGQNPSGYGVTHRPYVSVTTVRPMVSVTTGSGVVLSDHVSTTTTAEPLYYEEADPTTSINQDSSDETNNKYHSIEMSDESPSFVEISSTPQKQTTNQLEPRPPVGPPQNSYNTNSQEVNNYGNNENSHQDAANPNYGYTSPEQPTSDFNKMPAVGEAYPVMDDETSAYFESSMLSQEQAMNQNTNQVQAQPNKPPQEIIVQSQAGYYGDNNLSKKPQPVIQAQYTSNMPTHHRPSSQIPNEQHLHKQPLPPQALVQNYQEVTHSRPSSHQPSTQSYEQTSTQVPSRSPPQNYDQITQNGPSSQRPVLDYEKISQTGYISDPTSSHNHIRPTTQILTTKYEVQSTTHRPSSSVRPPTEKVVVTQAYDIKEQSSHSTSRPSQQFDDDDDDADANQNGYGQVGPTQNYETSQQSQSAQAEKEVTPTPESQLIAQLTDRIKNGYLSNSRPTNQNIPQEQYLPRPTPQSGSAQAGYLDNTHQSTARPVAIAVDQNGNIQAQAGYFSQAPTFEKIESPSRPTQAPVRPKPEKVSYSDVETNYPSSSQATISSTSRPVTVTASKRPTKRVTKRPTSPKKPTTNKVPTPTHSSQSGLPPGKDKNHDATKPSNQKQPLSTSYVTGPTTPRPDIDLSVVQSSPSPNNQLSDKVDSYISSTQGPVYSSIYLSSPTDEIIIQNGPIGSINQNYNNNKPLFVKIPSATQKTPSPTIVITPKPTVVNLIAASSSPYRPNTTPLPSNSYIYSPLVTRRPEYSTSSTQEYISIPQVTSNEFDDPGYSGLHNPTTPGSNKIPTDDRPAFPGYYGPTPSYPNFELPSDKYGSNNEEEEETYTSPNDFVNFPPVRNPNLNMSATSSSVTNDLELSTPAFVEDTILKDKMNTLVHKIVESLQDNFEALADMIDDNNNTITGFSETTAAPTTLVTRRPASKAPTRKPTAKPSSSSSGPTRVSTKRPPTRISTAAPTTTRKPAVVTTKKPLATTRKPTTKKPVTRKPTRKVTAPPTTAQPIRDEVIEEEDEVLTNEVDDNIGEESGGGGGGRKFQCGVRPHIKSGRIVGGKGATFGEFPWQVLVRESTWLGLFTKNKCGGVLISNKYVVTAAHCQPGFLASLVAVMGEHDISGDLESKRSVTKNVKRVIVHRQYDAATFENDLALLELESAVNYDTHIVPICMPADAADFTGRMATVTGWGRLKYGGGVPSVLQEVQVPIIENSVCQEMFNTAGHEKKILKSFLCAGYANGQKDSCEGDSGGPLVLQRADGRYELAGTVSHGIRCANPYLPGVYMRTTYYKPWLRSITGVK